jgi:lyso-ornithine lipid O-acyltransferase
LGQGRLGEGQLGRGTMGKLNPMGSTILRLSRAVAYLAWTVALMPVQGIGLLLGRRWVAELPVFYHRHCCRILGLKVTRIGRPVSARPVLFVSNHVSYADISVLGSLIPGSFVAKAEIAGWLFFGWLAKLQRSVFVDRQVRSTARQRDAIAERLAARDALILFPEGTSGDGNFVLPFKSALFSVVFGRGDHEIAVQPVSISYTKLDGLPIGRQLRPNFAWYGNMTLPPHLWRFLGLGTVEVVVEFHPPTTVAEWSSRKELARFCYDRISGGVGRHLSGRDSGPVATAPRPRREPVPSDIPASAAL